MEQNSELKQGKKISSRFRTVFLKTGTKVMMAIFMLVFIQQGLGVYGAAPDPNLDPTVKIAIIALSFILTALFFLITAKKVFPLMDEVYDHGDQLVFVRSGRKEKILLSSIVNIDWDPWPGIVIVNLHRADTHFGKKIVFSPSFWKWPPKKIIAYLPEACEELKVRIKNSKNTE